MIGRWQAGYGDSFESDKYKKLSTDDYKLYLEPYSIQHYLQKLLIIQNRKRTYYFPCYKREIKNYYKLLSSSFNPECLRYRDNSQLERVSRFIADIGRSGYDYINSIDKVIELNKPVLLFYGIEHLSTFYLNLHLNFTEENSNLSSLSRRKVRIHGINPFSFYDITSEFNLEDLLNSRLKFGKYGLAPRFFLLLDFPTEYFFIKHKEISLIDLLQCFFIRTSIGISREIQNRFIDEYKEFFKSSEMTKKMWRFEDLDLFTFYCLSFLFSHLARYRMSAWKTILSQEEKYFGFFIKFIIKTIQNMFIRRIFSKIHINYDRFILKIRQLEHI
ncbi:MAG: hypothetical protein ACFFCV_06410 [Promethearchaeota archaeon]